MISSIAMSTLATVPLVARPLLQEGGVCQHAFACPWQTPRRIIMSLAEYIPLSVLYLEDNPDDAEIAAALLQQGGYNVTMHRVETREEFERGIRVIHPDIILLDCTLPHYSAEEALMFVKQTQCPTPCIVLTGAYTDEYAFRLLKCGAYDYLLKDRLFRLSAAVKEALEHYYAQQDRAQTLEFLDGYVEALDIAQGHVPLTDKSAQELFDEVRIEAQHIRQALQEHNGGG